MSFSDAAGSPLTPDQVLQLVRRCGRQHLIRKVALLGAVLANEGVMSSRARAMTVYTLARLDGGPYGAVNLAAAWVRTQPKNRVIATEKSLYLLAALALLEGAENEQDPVDGYVAFCLMALNDYASRWRTEDKLGDDERLVADLVHATRFNRGGDPLRDLVRAEMIMSTRPRRDRELRNPHRWNAFQVRAFGQPLREYFVPMAALALLSQGWGRPNRTGELNQPFIAKSAWLGRGARHAPEGAEFVSPLVMTLDEARDVAQRSRFPDGIPFLPTEFYRKPLVELAGDVAVPYPRGLCASSCITDSGGASGSTRLPQQAHKAESGGSSLSVRCSSAGAGGSPSSPTGRRTFAESCCSRARSAGQTN